LSSRSASGVKCLFNSSRKCEAMSDPRMKEIYKTDVIKFIHLACSMCIKKQYADAIERLSKRKYTIVNNL